MLLARPKIEVAPRRKLAVAGAAVAAVVFLVGGVMGVRALGGAQPSRPGDGASPGNACRRSSMRSGPPARSATVWFRFRTRTHSKSSAATNRTTCSGSRRARSQTSRSVVDQRCAEAFEGFVGRAPDDSTLDIAQTRPSAESWEQGDRNFQCYLGDRRASACTGDARATGW